MFDFIYNPIKNLYDYITKNTSTDDPMNKFFDDICHNLKKTDDPRTHNSIDYLQRQDVRDQFKNLCEEFEIYKLTPKIFECLDIAYLEIIVESTNGLKYKFNFWPCSDCACIGYEQVQTN